MPTELTNALLRRRVQPGSHDLEFYARWATEYEGGELDRAAARFWAQNERYSLLYGGCSMEDILEEWDEEEHGSQPEEGSPEWIFEGWFDCGDCSSVYRNVELILPREGFFVEPLPEPDGDEGEEERRTIPLADLAGTSCVAFEAVSEDKLYLRPAPATWQEEQEWKGNTGNCTLEVEEEVTLFDLLTSHPLKAEVWTQKDESRPELSDTHYRDLEVGEECVEWENGNGKSRTFLVEPPDNMRLWRVVGFTAGRLLRLYRRTTDRLYAPGGAGMEAALSEFETLAGGVV